MTFEFKISQDYFKRHLSLYYYCRRYVQDWGSYIEIRRKSDRSPVAWSLASDMDARDMAELRRWRAKGLGLRKRCGVVT